MSDHEAILDGGPAGEASRGFVQARINVSPRLLLTVSGHRRCRRAADARLHAVREQVAGVRDAKPEPGL